MSDTRTERFPLRPDVEAIFQAFVRTANAYGNQAKTTDGAPGQQARLAREKLEVALDLSTLDSGSAALQMGGDMMHSEELREALSMMSMEVSLPGAELDLSAGRGSAPPPAADEQIGERELEQTLEDMGVLLRYGHQAEVGERLEELLRKYPADLVLLRRIAGFHLEHRNVEFARETLFVLATRLYQRNNLTGMRAALQQVLDLAPGDQRVERLLELIDHGV